MLSSELIMNYLPDDTYDKQDVDKLKIHGLNEAVQKFSSKREFMINFANWLKISLSVIEVEVQSNGMIKVVES